jgi:hypothetical protein
MLFINILTLYVGKERLSYSLPIFKVSKLSSGKALFFRKLPFYYTLYLIQFHQGLNRG